MKKPTIAKIMILIGIILILGGLFYPTNGNAQSITISPKSMAIWGKTPDIISISIEHKNFEVIGLLPSKKYPYWNGEYMGEYNKFNIGLFYKPINIQPLERVKLSGATGAFFRKFPTNKGSIIHFLFETNIRLTNSISLQYQHISNGFGIQNSFNPGIDNISIKFSF